VLGELLVKVEAVTMEGSVRYPTRPAHGLPAFKRYQKTKKTEIFKLPYQDTEGTRHAVV